MATPKTTLRDLAIALLKDDHGITQEAWLILYGLMERAGEKVWDIANALCGVEGRRYLPEDWESDTES